MTQATGKRRGHGEDSIYWGRVQEPVRGCGQPGRRYAVGDALEDRLAHGVDGLSARTVTLYRGTIIKALAEELGAVKLTELTASDIQQALAAMTPRLSTGREGRLSTTTQGRSVSRPARP